MAESRANFQLNQAESGRDYAAVQPLTFDKAVAAVASLSVPVKQAIVALSNAKNRVLTEDVRAKVNGPPFDRCMMDGYAIRAADVYGPNTTLKVVGHIAAGEKQEVTVGQGETIRVATGSPLPGGADSVARFEWCDAMDDGFIRVLRPISCGESVQPRGTDACVGQVILPSGMKLTGPPMAVCKSFGVTEVTVSAQPLVALIITGNELVNDGYTRLQSGQIYSSNDVFLLEALQDDGCIVSSVVYAGDNETDIYQAVENASKRSDYVIITGGVSAGDFDYVPNILHDLGKGVILEKVLMRPGSPFVATRFNGATVFGMSGNPAACLIQFETLVRPVVRRTLGMHDGLFEYSGKLIRPLELKPIKHVRILRGYAMIRNGEVLVDTHLSQSPAVLSSLATSNCLIYINGSDLPEGSIVPLRWINVVS